MVLYLMIGWPASIGIIFLFSRNLGNDSGTEPDERGDGRLPKE